MIGFDLVHSKQWQFLFDIYFEYVFSFRFLGRILKFDYVRSAEFTAEERQAQEDFKNFASVNRVGFIYINVVSRILRYCFNSM